MAKQKFSSLERQAIWLAHNKKCAYTSELIAIENMQIDHIIPESLDEKSQEWQELKAALFLPDDFSLSGFENILPAKIGVNLRKGSTLLDTNATIYFLAFARSKKSQIEKYLNDIESQLTKGKATILLQSLLEKGLLSSEEVMNIIDKYQDKPTNIFRVLESLKFANGEQISIIDRAKISELELMTIAVWEDGEGLLLVSENDTQKEVKNCKQYWEAINNGFYSYSTVGIKMEAIYKHQCGLLKALSTARLPEASFISNPIKGVVDLDLLPFSMFPYGADEEQRKEVTYRDKLREGDLIINVIRQNYLSIQQKEGFGQILTEVARADFNDDGLEDILVYYYAYATHGTMGAGGVMLLTRKDFYSPFVAEFLS